MKEIPTDDYFNGQDDVRTYVFSRWYHLSDNVQIELASVD